MDLGKGNGNENGKRMGIENGDGGWRGKEVVVLKKLEVRITWLRSQCRHNPFL
jgi:hypothetical protein